MGQVRLRVPAPQACVCAPKGKMGGVGRAGGRAGGAGACGVAHWRAAQG